MLAEDTLYYRHDHPNGFLFSAGNAEPDPADGWVLAPEDIVQPTGPVYECTTLAAYDALLKQERKAAQKSAQQLTDALAALNDARTAILALTAELQAKSAGA